MGGAEQPRQGATPDRDLGLRVGGTQSPWEAGAAATLLRGLIKANSLVDSPQSSQRTRWWPVVAGSTWPRAGGRRVLGANLEKPREGRCHRMLPGPLGVQFRGTCPQSAPTCLWGAPSTLTVACPPLQPAAQALSLQDLWPLPTCGWWWGGQQLQGELRSPQQLSGFLSEPRNICVKRRLHI